MQFSEKNWAWWLPYASEKAACHEEKNKASFKLALFLKRTGLNPAIQKYCYAEFQQDKSAT